MKNIVVKVNSVPTRIRRVFTTLALLGILLSSALLPTASARVDDVLVISPTLVKDIYPNPNPEGSMIGRSIRKGNILYFVARDADHGSELWRTDGTTDGTWMVKDINPGIEDGRPRGFALYGDLIIFRATHPEYGVELWRTDGTEEGTWMLKDIAADAANSNPGCIILVRGKILFTAADWVNGTGLWSTDGTSSGTTLVKIVSNSGFSSEGYQCVVYNDTLIFNMETTSTTFELWRSDGTADGTLPFYGPLSFGEMSYQSVRDMVVFNNRVYLDMSIDQDGSYLWSTDGTRQGTRKVRLMQTLPFFQPANLTPIGNTLYFTGIHPTSYSTYIWKLQAGSNDAQLVTLFTNPYGWPSIAPFYDMGSQGVLFYYQVATSGNPNLTFAPGIWKKLDTEGNITDVCLDCLYDVESGDEAYLWYGKLYFPARGSVPGTGNGLELWVTDGTALGTYELFDLNPNGSSYPQLIRPVDGTMFFSGDDGVVGSELWSFDISLSHVFLPMTRR